MSSTGRNSIEWRGLNDYNVVVHVSPRVEDLGVPIFPLILTTLLARSPPSGPSTPPEAPIVITGTARISDLARPFVIITI
jgi:hypothetical protein